MHKACTGRAAPESEVEAGLAGGVLVSGGLAEGIVAAGGQVHGAVAQGHGVLDGDDLQARDRGEAGKVELAGSVGLGHHRFRGRGQGEEHGSSGRSDAPSPEQAGIMARPTFSPALTETMARPSFLGPDAHILCSEIKKLDLLACKMKNLRNFILAGFGQ